MGNKQSNDEFQRKLTDDESAEFRRLAVKKIRSLYKSNKPKYNTFYVKKIIHSIPFGGVDEHVICSNDELLEYCKEAIPVPFVIIDHKEFKVSLVQNYNAKDRVGNEGNV